MTTQSRPSWLKSIAFILRQEGYQVKEAQSAAEALTVLAKFRQI
jgi:CheY-like chemotaxis protein